MKVTKLLIAAGFVSVSFLASAQPSAPTAVQQENLQQNSGQVLSSLHAGTNAPEIYSGEESDIGPQHILKVVPRRTYFSANVDSEYLFTDNAFLSEPKKVSSTIFVNTIAAALAPEPYRLGAGRFAPTVGVQSQWYKYGLGGHHSPSALDFNVETVFLGGKYLLPDNWVVYGEFDYNRFLTEQNYREFYHDITPVAGVQRLVKLSDNMVLSLGLKGDYHDAWVPKSVSPFANSQDRADGTFSASLVYQVVPRVTLQPYYRFQYNYYRFDSAHAEPNPHSRNDSINSVGISAAYYFTDNLALRAFFDYDARESGDVIVPDYRVYNVGADLSYTLRF